MRKTWIIACAAAAVALAGCNREFDAPVPGDGFLRATIETPSRVSFTDEGVFSWQAGDAIAVSTNAGFKTFTLQSGEGAASGVFDGDLGGVTSATVAVYPAAVAKDDATVTLPAEYAWAEGQSNAVMFCDKVSLTEVNSFKHLGGILKIAYAGIPADADALVLKAEAKITGDFTIADGVIAAGAGTDEVKVTFAAGSNPAAFYIPVPTGEYKFSVELQKAGAAIEGTQKATSKAIKVERKSLILMDPIAAGSASELKMEIATAEDFLDFVANAKQYAATDEVKLTADITLPETFAPDTLWCNFNGQGHKVTYTLASNENLADVPAAANLGLFRVVDGTVKNLKAAGSVSCSATSGTYHIGGIAGMSAENSVFENCESAVHVYADTKLTHHMGGIAGFSSTGTVFRNCRNTGKVEMIVEGSANASQIGGIVGHLDHAAIIEGCVNDADLTYSGNGTARLGGMVGYLYGPTDITIKDCVNNGAILARGFKKDQYTYAGGISGYFQAGTAGVTVVVFENCFNNGKVTGEMTGNAAAQIRLAGIVSLAGSNATITVKDCVNNGEVFTDCLNTKTVAGGVIAFNEATGITTCDGCANYAPVSAPDANSGIVGGLVGQSQAEASTFTSFIVGSASNVKVGSGLVGAAIGKAAALKTAMTGKVSGLTVTKGETATVLTADNYREFILGDPTLGEGGSTEGVVFDGTAMLFSGGSGTESDPYLLKTAADLVDLAAKLGDEATYADFSGKCYRLVADIDMAGQATVPAGTLAQPFKGQFDGNGKTIANLSVAGLNADNPASGLFGYTQDAVIKNLTVRNRSNSGEFTRVAGIAGEAHNTVFDNCHITGGELSSAVNLVGGIVGDMYGGSVKNCTASDVKVSSVKNYASAIVGFGQEGTVIENCKILSGTVVSGANEIGGIAAKMEGGSVKGCTADGAVVSSTAEDVGAIAGWVIGECVISDCVVTGSSVTVGTNYGGGFVGLLEKSTIKDCTLTGKSAVTGNKSGTGGIVGYAKKVDISVLENCTVDGECVISGVNNTGGIVGWVDAAKLKNCTVTGKSQIVSSSDGTGGLVGRAICKSGADNWVDGCKVNGGVLVKGKYSVAGLIGYAYPDKNGNLYIINSGVSNATVQGTLCDTGGDPEKGDCMNGGILGWARFSDAGSKGWIVNCYAYLDAMTIDLNMTHPSVGGIVGYCSLSSAGQFEVLNCVSTLVKEQIMMAGSAILPTVPQVGSVYGWLPDHAAIKVSGNYCLSGDLPIGSSGESVVIENNIAVTEAVLKDGTTVKNALNAFVSGQSTYPLKAWTASAGSLPMFE